MFSGADSLIWEQVAANGRCQSGRQTYQFGAVTIETERSQTKVNEESNENLADPVAIRYIEQNSDSAQHSRAVNNTI
jgi:hypothetical protein